MGQIKKKTISTALGAVAIASLASVSLQANASIFSMQKLESGYMQIAQEGKCGEGKCGGDMMKAEAKVMKEGKCGEGKCGGDMMKPKVKVVKEGNCGAPK